VVLLFAFVILLDQQAKEQDFWEKKRVKDISSMVFREFRHKGYLNEDFIEHLEELKFKVIEKEKCDVMIEQAKYKVKLKRTHRHHQIEIFSHNGKSLIRLTTPFNEQIVLKDTSKSLSHKSGVIGVFGALFLLLVFIYFHIYRTLKPIKQLKEKIIHLGDEKVIIEPIIDKKDEISQLQNEFFKSAKKLQDIKESRNIFIRNIMHELKTPITKGKLLVNLEQTEPNKEKMEMVFIRLESLIQEFASIEELLSTKKELDKKEYNLDDIIEEASDILMCDETNLLKEYQDMKIKVDFPLFKIAIKNLIDNGIKYSDKKEVTIKNEANKIIFENEGKALEYPLENYFEPFFKGDEVTSNTSFGLGLYIVYHILSSHGMKLEYSYKNGLNQFTILL
jgi:two-component system OmpR family sensor kinase